MLACTMPTRSDDATVGELASLSRRLTDGTALSGAAWEEERRRKKKAKKRENEKDEEDEDEEFGEEEGRSSFLKLGSHDQSM